NLYFVGSGQEIAQLPALVARDGAHAAAPAADPDGILDVAFHPVGLTVILVYSDATAEVFRGLAPDFQLTPTLRQLRRPGASLGASQSASP
ncbi:MAG: hypothetical protein ACRDNS_35810, partial [Trebonia sp.]